MNLFNRFQGVFFNPKETFKALSERAVWVDAFIVLLVLVTIFSFIIAPYLQKDQLEAFKSDVERQERLGPERYQQQLEFLENPPSWYPILMIISPLLANLIGFFFPALILLALGRLFSTDGNYKQLLSGFMHASIVDKIFGNAVRLILILTRKSVFQTTTSLALFFPRLEITSVGFRVLSQFDFFQIWLYGILAYSLSFIFKIEIKKAFIISYGFWALKSLFYIGLGFLGMQ